MKVRVKIYCASVKETHAANEWVFTPAYPDNKNPDDPNSKFWQFIPNGELRMTAEKKVYKGQQPIVGHEYILEITTAPTKEKK